MGKAQNDPCIMNIWVHDGSKDMPVQRKKYREILAASLDEIMEEKLDGVKNCFEAKLFGIGLESYTVGSHDFYTAYCATRKQMYTLDTGHYEQTENVSDFVSTLLMYVPELMLHVSRPVRWDSDHVTIMNDQTLDLFKELVRCDALDRAHVGLDYFDASINRIGAYIIGSRATQKCILQALLEPKAKLREYEDNGQYFERLALMEEAKSMPFGAVFDYFNLKNNVPVGEEYIQCIQQYEKDVTQQEIIKSFPTTMANSGSLKSTIAVSLTNYLDAGAIVAGASGLTLWQNYLGLSEVHLGWLNFISANCLGAAIGAIIGGFLADKYGRKFIFTYNLLVYMTGVLLIMLSMNFPMLLAGFLVTGVSVGVGVPASWTYISESSEVNNRGRNICISQMSWGVGPMMILLLGMFFAPGGYFFDFVEAVAYIFSDAHLPCDKETVNVFSSRIVFFSLFVVAFIAWNLQRQLQESAEFTAQKADEKKNGLMDNIKVLFQNKVAVKTVCFLAGIYLTWNLVASVMGFFQPHIYETAGGVSNETANWMNFIQWAIIVGITFVTSKLIDKTSHKAIYVFGLLVAISAWLIIVTIGVNGPVGLWSFAILWGIQGGTSVQIFYALWGSELFPAKFRAGAQGLMFFIVRGLSAVWGLVFTVIYGENGEGFTIAAWCMIILLAISLIVGFIGAPNTRCRALEDITKERYGESY